MSIWQNIKEADYTVEKLLLKGIGGLLIGLIFFFLVDKAFDQIPDVKQLFKDNSLMFSPFLLGFAATVFITALIYHRTLGLYEAETENSKIASIVNVIIWIVFWLYWSICCARVTLQTEAKSVSVQVALFILVTLPGIICFIYTNSFRIKQIKDEEESKQRSGDKY